MVAEREAGVGRVRAPSTTGRAADKVATAVVAMALARMAAVDAVPGQTGEAEVRWVVQAAELVVQVVD